MSIQIPAAFVTEFDEAVKHLYQTGSVLKDTIRMKSNVVGSTCRFTVYGKGQATPRLPGTDVVPINYAVSQVTATLEDWNAAVYTDIFDGKKINHSEVPEAQMLVSNAAGRRLDQIIINALNTGANAATVAKTIGANQGMNVTKVRELGFLMDDRGVPNDGERYLAISAKAKAQLLADTQATSSDFMELKAYMTGEIPSFYGFKIKLIETRDEGGLPLATNDRTCLGYHKSAAGLAVGMDIRSEINYIPEKTSTLINTMLSAGSVAIDNTGIFKVIIDQTV
jgi:hypothetical protein